VGATAGGVATGLECGGGVDDEDDTVGTAEETGAGDAGGEWRGIGCACIMAVREGLRKRLPMA
jgi:hypothetical protein